MSNYEIVGEGGRSRYQAYEDTRPVNAYITKVVALREVTYEELEAVETSFQAAQRTMDQIQAQIKELRVKLQSTTGKSGGISKGLGSGSLIDWDEEAKLEGLKKEVRSLKYKIPYTLIYPPPPTSVVFFDQQQQLNVPNVVWHHRITSRNHTSTTDNTFRLQRIHSWENIDRKLAQECNPNFYFLHHPDAPPMHTSQDYFDQCARNIDRFSTRLLEFFKCFPQAVIIKKTLLFHCLQANFGYLSQEKDALNKLIAKGFLKPICKRSTLSISSYWMPCAPYRAIQSAYFYTSPDESTIHLFSPTPVDEQEIIYSDNQPILDNMKSLKSLLLGKWHRSLPLSQHIEVADPNKFFKGMENLVEVEYISLRGISLITELPKFLTKLKKLEILDCKACHDLEVIPENINKLWRTLTHLDISDCCLLDHMPTTLSDLIHLRVLKGFHLGGPIQQRKSCTLRDLTKLSKLQKLHINTSVKGFPYADHLTDLQKFPYLQNLGISWRGCQTNEVSTTSATTVQSVLTHKDSIGGGGGGDQQQFSFQLEKLDLQCVPNTVTRVWLNPLVFKGLKKLYVRGGRFSDLGQKFDELKEENTPVIAKENQWAVEILRLKHLRELKMDKCELDSLFPELIALENVDCPNLISGRCGDSNIWVKPTHLPPTLASIQNLYELPKHHFRPLRRQQYLG